LYRGLSQDALAERLGTDKTTISKLELGQRSLTTLWLARIGHELGVSAAELLVPPPSAAALTAPAKTSVEHPAGSVVSFQSLPKDVPVLGTAIGGADGTFEANPLTGAMDYVRRPPGLAANKAAFAIYLVGTSMMPWAREGALLYVDPVRPPAVGDHVLVELHAADGTGHGLVKLLAKRTAASIHLRQYSPAQDIEIAARAVKRLYRICDWNELLGV
jgi:phage repressor protein C with HTH and peptisase S24 domain